MDATETPHAHHGSHTGRRWLDTAVAVSAIVVSLVSLALGIEHGRSMEKLVQANSWPFVEFDSHNIDEQGKPKFRLVLTNVGIGPARIQTFELWFDKKPMASAWDLLKACCGMPRAPIGLGNTAPNILRAGDHENFFTMAWEQDAALATRFNEGRGKITTRTCYCSVFDECWISAGLAAHADKVERCPAPAVPFRTDVPPPAGD
jgi:hypothetical protein